MPYIGRDTDKLSNIEVLDNITFDGSSSYTLQKGGSNFTPSSANNILISIDGVVQAGNFTVSGSTIDFGTAVAGTSTCDFILHYGVGLITTPSDGTVTTAKLADSSVSLAKLTATGTKDATTFLRGDNTFAVPGGGKVLQVATVNWGGDVNTSSGSYVQADSNFEVSLTPSSASNKILILMNGGNAYVNENREMKVLMHRKIGAGSYSGMSVTDVDSNTSQVGYVVRAVSATGQLQIPHSFSFLDTPNTTSAVTYTPYFRSETANAVYFNTPDNGNWNVSLTIMEIEA